MEENKMGKQRVVNKAVSAQEVLEALMAGSITIAQAQQMYNGVIPIGDYKGVAALLDLDLLVNQPLVNVEQQYIDGILSGREAGYDLATIIVPVTAIAGTLLSASLTVPDGELWYINAVSMVCPGDATAGFTMNWHCSLWTDRIGAAAGQPFRSAAAALAGINTHTGPGGGAINQLDEFGPVATAWTIENKVPLLRLPAGTVITFTVLTDTALPTVATTCTLGLYGAMGKVLVA